MNLYLRLVLTVLGNIFRSPLHPLQSLTLQFRVMPWDIDAFGHLNNGRYLQIADVARMGWMCRTPVWGAVIRNKWSALLGGTCIRHSKSLGVFQRYRVHTKLLSWDKRWVFIEHRFETLKGVVIAVAVTKAGLRSKKGWVTTEELARETVPNIQKPEFPEHLKLWLQADEALQVAGGEK